MAGDRVRLSGAQTFPALRPTWRFGLSDTRWGRRFSDVSASSSTLPAVSQEPTEQEIEEKLIAPAYL